MVPIPRATFFVTLNNLPSVNATFLIFSGLSIIGSKAISTKGTPRRSRPKNLLFFSSLISFAASYSKQID